MRHAAADGPRAHLFAGTDLLLAVELAGAIERREVILHHQPIVDMVTPASVVATEGLARWSVGGTMLLEPARFIPAIEAAGLGPIFTASVVETACADTATRHVGAVFANIFAGDLMGGLLVRDVARALDRTGLDPARLVLEISERDPLPDWERATQALVALNRLGVRVAIDDFGAGHSSLERLARLPADFVKLDRSLVERLGTPFGERDAVVVDATIRLAERLGAVVIAEGIELAEQAQVLVELGCRLGQGFYFGGPVADGATAHRIASSSA